MMVMNATARESHHKEARTGAVYLSIMNHGAKPDKLVGIKADVAESAELHSVTTTDGIMRMRPLGTIDIPAGATVNLSNEQHVMLFGLKAPLKKGEFVRLTLDFETADDMMVDAEVGAVAHMDHVTH